MIERERPRWEALNTQLNPPKPRNRKGQDEQPQPTAPEPNAPTANEQPVFAMTPESLAARSNEIERYRLALDLMKKINDGKNTLIRQMTAAGHDVPGFAVRPGAAQVAIREENDKPLSIRDAFDRLVEAALVPADSFDTALFTAGQFNASALRDFIAEENGVSATEAMTLLKDRLGDRSPLISTTKAGVVERRIVAAPVQAAQVEADTAPTVAPTKASGGKRR